MGIIKYIKLKDTEVFVFDDFIINQMKEGASIESHHNDKLNEIVQKYFSGKNMVYISNRVKSYSVNPLIYSEAEKIPNLLAIAVIAENQLMRNNAEYELKFFDKPCQIFDSLSLAIAWAHQIIMENKPVSLQ
ncbi:hypothetical protein Q4Q35_19730 [Flavivirga aquimarina]|uniref:Uncharacterized protein n=1 Tax=Flavivirga aquimarina TaxID=2027862 RepID=A0ABT8WG30_9FLAO|nr:hypothetical protein [Flavivirga aquimarina]MDO5972037.1 hypothetical protein [Flavivirga aquimarina]